MYSPTFWEHVRQQRNSRSLPDALVGEAQYKRCGDKLKIYLEAGEPPAGLEAVATARERADAALGVLEQEVRSVLDQI